MAKEVDLSSSERRRRVRRITDHSKLSQTRAAATTTDPMPKPRALLVAEAAYYLAERRGFAVGYENEDWLTAEQQVARLLDHA